MHAELPLLLTTLVSIIGTPGPNNFILFSSGLKNGYKGSFPLLLSINLGVISVVILSSFGAFYITNLIPNLEHYFSWISLLVLCYIAWRMWPKKSDFTEPNTADNRDRHQILGMYFFQYVNPKIWVISIGIITTFHGRLSTFVICMATLATGVTFNSLWVLAGKWIGNISSTSQNNMSKISSILIFFTALYFFVSEMR